MERPRPCAWWSAGTGIGSSLQWRTTAAVFPSRAGSPTPSWPRGRWDRATCSRGSRPWEAAWSWSPVPRGRAWKSTFPAARPDMIRLILADDHPIVLDGLVQLFRVEPDFEIVARCRDGEEALREVRVHRPDVLVLDVRMPRLDGLEVLRMVRQEELATRVVLLTAAVEEEQLVEALRLGVGGVVLKEMAPHLLL